MLKVATSIILLALFAATRIAPFGHAHTSSAVPEDHDVRPHVHLHSHGHEHDHAGDSTHQHHDASVDRSDERGIRGGELPHDHDAVYIGDAVAVPIDSRTSTLDWIESQCAMLLETADVRSVELSPPEAVAEPPPDPLVFGPTLFLRLLSLRI